MTKDQIKHALISLLVGALVSFILTLFQGILDFLKENAVDIIGGASATITYLVKNYYRC